MIAWRIKDNEENCFGNQSSVAHWDRVQLVIDKAENSFYDMVNELLDVMRNPYEEQAGRKKFAEKRPEWARNRAGCSMLSCSS